MGNGITVYFFFFLKYSCGWRRYWDPLVRSCVPELGPKGLQPSFGHEPDFVSLRIVQRQVNDALLLISVDLHIRSLRNKILIGHI